MSTASHAPHPDEARADLNLGHFRRLLTRERARITNDLQRLEQQDEMGGPAGELGELSDYDQHPADQATDTYFREQDLAVATSLKTELDQVDAACKKLENGTYGICDRCGTEIPADRLEALPFALFCMACASDLEGRF